LLDINLQDHLIITKNGYYSFCDYGILWESEGMREMPI
jgi:DNA repair protein RadC